MANHTSIFVRDNSITKESVLKAIEDINNELFDGRLPIKVEDNFIGLVFDNSNAITMWIEKDYEYHNWELYDTEGYEPEIIKGSYIDVRHGHGIKFLWWLDSVIIKELANRFNATLDGEGYDRDNRPEKYTYKTLREFIMNPFIEVTYIKLLLHRWVVKDELKWNKEIIGEELFDYVWKANVSNI
jgi:hypothetical protein